MNQTIAHLTVESLIANGIDNLYCVPGVQNDHFFNALYDRQEQLRPIQARHEQGAVYMALGAALATGAPQAFSIVPGPGFLNGSAALCTAYALNVSLFGVIGQISSGAIGKELGLLHEIEGQWEIATKLTKHADRIVSGTDAPEQLRQAWSALNNGRQRPVTVEIPVDVWQQETQFDLGALISQKESAAKPTSAEIKAALQLIKQSKKPMIVVGSGAQDHSDLVRKLADCIGAGVIAFRTGHGVMPSDHALSLNMPTGHALWPECDLVIGLGTRLFAQKKQWGLDAKINVLHIDIDASVLNRTSSPTIGINADLADVLPLLLKDLTEHPAKTDWLAAICAAKKKVANLVEEELAPQIGWLKAIRKVLPKHGVFVDELTQIGFVSRFVFPTYYPRTFLSTGYQGTLGWGIATAIGAAHARRDLPVVSITGDGGALFTITELATAVHHNVPVNVIVMNDNAYGNVRGIQRDEFEGRYIASDLTSPDFVALAQSFGVDAARATTPDELEKELSKAIENDGPNLIEVPVGEFPSPWKFIALPQVRGK